MLIFANLFFLLFVLDAFLSLVFGVFTFPSLELLQQVSGSTLFIISVLFYTIVGVSNRFSKMMFFPLIFFVFWKTMGAFPISLYYEGRWFPIIIGISQFFLVFYLVIYSKTDHRFDILGSYSESIESSISFKRVIIFSLANFILFPPIVLLYSAFAIKTSLAMYSADFIEINQKGIYTESRIYQKNDQRIQLIGMMHIGAGSYYSEVDSVLIKDDSIILLEGVTDNMGRLKSGLNYGKLASMMGLETQNKLQFKMQDRISKRADVDLSQFSPITMRVLNRLSLVLNSSDLSKAVDKYLSFSKEVTPGDYKIMMKDLLELRNDRVLKEAKESLKKYKSVVIPWGALHMIEIDEKVRSWGFKLASKKEIKIIDFQDGLSSLTSKPAK